ncbi:cytochrome b/b6 domain-containing protein [Erwinia sp. MMLR14_017]|uniref:cytochrome b/b6 domain-containing protein n=1 Tax=Erwinia sp. MMLR14_017 TaxID=3093842 RepID=UPI00298FDBC6|nr:cytochrome b/b6 domain-containing protein [Erwinia sp. MMLR14_017]MDW8844569.1 cytochrome b/b6 domain-containing protein [Erwinia sp. MMLR14_017]
MSDEISQPSSEVPSRKQFIRRHSLIVRVTHWINVMCVSVLLMTGLQIFNAHPRLYWGEYGTFGDHALLEIGSEQQGNTLKGFLRIGSLRIITTNVLGVSQEENSATARAFPAWATMPSYQDLGAGRQWHFFFAWLFVINGFVYILHGICRSHFRKNVFPDKDQLRPKNLWHEINDHARLKFAKGEEARRYNALQKITYLLVIFILLPLMIISGLTMSPALDATFPFLTDLFGGRPSARMMHFITATLLVSFIIVHVLMVLFSGFWNNIRSMITGSYAIETQTKKSKGESS